MNSKFKILLILVCMTSTFFSCDSKENSSTTSIEESANTIRVTEKDIENLEFTEYVLSDASEKVVSNWLKFQELSNEIETLKKADLSFFGDDKELLKTFVAELKSELPERLNKPSIVVRLLALETNLYKLHDEVIFNRDNKESLLIALKEVLIGHTNLIFQINKKLEKDAQKIEKPN